VFDKSSLSKSNTRLGFADGCIALLTLVSPVSKLREFEFVVALVP